MSDDYDVWFREQVRQAIREADGPNAEWVSHDTVKADMAAQREALRRQISGIGQDTPAPERS
ncbi:hypothetical protein [Burkholderia ubonensis]|uniref:hypothetical protein n=1 Tax=Burkholderia ubonensis TaxID=101571 RepID=UPI0007529E47|nr:hypothetical protein [Burkholderia ubonensis]